MPAVWRDPEDITPGARRTPKEIVGWRTYCPLRRMSGHPNSGITAQHIMAADRLREQVDLATLGYSAARPLIFIAHAPASRYGLGPKEVDQMRAVREVRRVVKLFTIPDLDIIQSVLLANWSLRQWVAHPACRSKSSATEKRKLLLILDRLVAHFDSDIEDELARGSRLTP